MTDSYRSRFVDGLVSLDAAATRQRLAVLMRAARASTDPGPAISLTTVERELAVASRRAIQRLADALDRAASDAAFYAERDARLANPEPAPPAPVVAPEQVKSSLPPASSLRYHRPAPTVATAPAPAPAADAPPRPVPEIPHFWRDDYDGTKDTLARAVAAPHSSSGKR